MTLSWYFPILSLIGDNIIVDWNLGIITLNIFSFTHFKRYFIGCGIPNAMGVKWEIFGHREKIAVIWHRIRLFQFRKSMLLSYFPIYRSVFSSYSPFNTQATTYLNELPRRPSRWRKSKTWRWPSSPQIHQKYIYMWNNSYRTSTDRWQKTSDFPKGKKLPTYLGRAKEKKKNRDKRIGTGPAPLGASCEGGKVSTH